MLRFEFGSTCSVIKQYLTLVLLNVQLSVYVILILKYYSSEFFSFLLIPSKNLRMLLEHQLAVYSLNVIGFISLYSADPLFFISKF